MRWHGAKKEAGMGAAGQEWAKPSELARLGLQAEDRDGVVYLRSGSFPCLLSIEAVGKLREILDEEGDEGLMLRIFVSGGGCSGFTYGFSMDSQKAEDDMEAEFGLGVKALLDCMSAPYLDGAALHYEEGLMGQRFVVRNPNAVTTCGCGSSFSA